MNTGTEQQPQQALQNDSNHDLQNVAGDERAILRRRITLPTCQIGPWPLKQSPGTMTVHTVPGTPLRTPDEPCDSLAKMLANLDEDLERNQQALWLERAFAETRTQNVPVTSVQRDNRRSEDTSIEHRGRSAVKSSLDLMLFFLMGTISCMLVCGTLASLDERYRSLSTSGVVGITIGSGVVWCAATVIAFTYVNTATARRKWHGNGHDTNNDGS